MLIIEVAAALILLLIPLQLKASVLFLVAVEEAWLSQAPIRPT